MKAVAPARRRHGAVLLALVALAALLGFYAVVILPSLGDEGLEDFVGRWVYDAVVVGAALLVLARAWRRPRERGAWLALGAGMLFWALGQTYYSVFLYYASPAPFPSPADLLFLAFYPAIYVGLALLLRARIAQLEPLGWVDGLIGALAVAAVAAALIFPPVLEALGGSGLGVAVSLAYPCADLVLLGLLCGALTAKRWSAQPALTLIAVAILLFAVSDVVYLSVGGQSTEALNLASVGWPLAFLLLAGAAWLPSSVGGAPRAEAGRRRPAAPVALGASAVCLLALGNFIAIGAAAAGLSIACLAAVLVRLSITYSQNTRMLEASREEAVTDQLTGLGNRRRLMLDLEHVLAAGPGADDTLLAIFDLDGFKAYNDGFGHPAGDDLLRRLGQRLEADQVEGGRAYRLGGDEFCVLAPTASGDPDAICRAAAEALSQSGTAFAVSASWGMVLIPSEAGSAEAAMRLADRRMYATKGRRIDSVRSQTRGVLLSVLHEREPGLDSHLKGVARHAAGLGRALGLDSEQLDVLVRAAELHDIGKVAIPDEILHKLGPLNSTEWALMRKHTLIGERVLNAAPALQEVAHIVRSTHEHWDGSGYPDGLAGEEIPLASRIIVVCDAFNAMTEGRPYREPVPEEEAVEILRAGAGGHFDPELVELFVDQLAPARPPAARAWS
jgi:two-component system, cell cycle response regulator